ncbi:MAG: hypothetical protein JJ863_11095 [Deltaproteobacteria bacterium]|nr:hypothetical protein [Deltaproteobacteria bacterium]
MADDKKKKSKKKKADAPEPEAPEAVKASEPAAEAPKVKRSAFDKVMRGALFVGLGALMTAPLWCTDEMTGAFRQPTTFSAERGDEDDSTQGKLATILEGVIRTAASDEMVEEEQISGEMAAVLEEAGIGDPESRREEAMGAIGTIVARAAEADGNRGLSSLQEQAIAGQARMMARTLITTLGGQVEGATMEEPEGEWADAAWPLLKGFPYEEGMNLPGPINALDGKNAKAWGYLIALEENQYLLVQSLWSCCFGAPPEINEAIVVRVPERMAERVRNLENHGVQVYGHFEASEAYEDDFVTSLYRLDAQHVLPL